MCLECLERFGVPLDPAHHAAIKRRPNRHISRVKKITGPATSSAPLAVPQTKTTRGAAPTFRR